MARFTLPRDLYHGKGALEALKSFKGKKAMICVGGGSMKRFGFLDRAQAYLEEAGMEVRIFDEPTKLTVYKRQTAEANEKGESNCPLCALGNDNNRNRLYKFSEMDADHVTAWSKGGETSIENCQMLCKTHNRAKGNK